MSDVAWTVAKEDAGPAKYGYKSYESWIPAREP